MLVPRSVVLFVVLVASGCRVLPDRDHLDREGVYHEEIVDEGSYAVYQHYGATWKKVGYVWVAPGAERSVWVLRRPATGGYPYRPPSPNTQEMWTRFRRIGREDASLEELVAAEGIDASRFYAVESRHSTVELPGPDGGTADVPASMQVAASEPLEDGDYRLLQAEAEIGYAWVRGEEEIYLVEDRTARAIEASTAHAAALGIAVERIGDASPTWLALAQRQRLPLADYAVLACDCRAYRTAGLH